ncbi:anthranilate synthase component I [Longispora fulva]|uniref:Anthranilate synthase component 1 n=1 Tax=Longispora fulva TaxID=619741 RepID=A0A8J7GXQ1_9ACTN|nr:anthranilate synthase component 1 [Longispora fulva]GIG62774.1 anthranilate synthase component I [Longispora fulva]
MTTGEILPDEATFHALAAGRRVVPVTRRLLADAETPVGMYRKLAGGPGTFLLESAEAGGVWSRYSFIGVRSCATLTERDGRGVWLGDPPAGVPTGGDPLEMLRATAELLASPRVEGLPSLTGGLVGYLAYDIVRRIEKLPVIAEDDLHLPELGMLLATDLAVLDHLDGSVLLISNAILPETGASGGHFYADAVRRLDEMATALAQPTPPMVATMTRMPAEHVVGRTPEGGYGKAVEVAKEAIRAGECFQIVPSQRFETDTDADPLDIYRVLRATNPSPYMYLLRFDDVDIVGSSPEAHVKVTGRRALLHPIAGTRPRGATPEEDAALAHELLADPKERAEHVMLVDLGRNDLGRVCVPGSVHVPEFFQVERYSHVMHIVSTVVGELEPDRTALDALTATFPAGTLSGAPKVRAMEIIEELEPTRRGLYGGTVGYVDFAGDLDMAIAIRTALIRDGRAYVQAGAGVVADSDPATEDLETRNKAAAVLSAIASAGTLRPARATLPAHARAAPPAGARVADGWQGTG